MESCGKSFLPLMCDSVPEQFRLKAETELGETKEKASEGLKQLRDFLSSENYPPNTDDTFLLQFLRQQKFDLNNAKKKLKQHYRMREQTAELYQSMDLDVFRAIMDSKVVGLLPYRDKEGRTIVYANAQALDLETFSAPDLFKCTLALSQFACSLPLSSVSGLNLLGEATYPSIPYCFSIFKEARKYIWIQNCLPFRVQRIDFFNEFSLFHYLCMGICVFLPSKYAKRLRFHGSGRDFVHEVYHPSIIPDEFGGTMGPLSNSSYVEEFLAYARRLKAESHLYQKLC